MNVPRLINMAKQLLSVACFAYGCLATSVFLIWHVATIYGPIWAPNSEALKLVLMIHIVVLALSFNRENWDPLFEVTTRRIWWAKVSLGVVSALCILHFILLWVVSRTTVGEVEPKWVLLLLISLLLGSSVYLIARWAFLPENLFSPKVRQFLANPLLYPFLKRGSHGKKRRK